MPADVSVPRGDCATKSRLPRSESSMQVESFDFIVTGAGSAGCAVAARLSEVGAYRVLLLEAGRRDRNPWIHIPLGSHKLFTHPRYNWKFESEPVAGLNNRTSYQPRGKMLGGTSSLNGLIYMRGTPGDYDGWRQRGCQGWDYASVLPYFKKAENQQRGASEFHGVGGPLNVCDQPFRHELVEAMLAASVEAGIAPNADFNGASQDGVGRYQATALAGRRCSAAAAYLKPTRNRHNLVVRPEAHATRILIEDGRAVGIQYRSRRGLETAHCRGEVIVCGGVYGSPQLLLLSGIGPGDHLQEMGIPVLRDLPAVGANLHDHFNSYVAFRCAKPITLNDLARSPLAKVTAALQYAVGPPRPPRWSRALRRRLCAQRSALGSATPANEFFPLEHQKARCHRRISTRLPGLFTVAGAFASGRTRQRASRLAGPAGSAAHSSCVPVDRLRHRGHALWYAPGAKNCQPAVVATLRGGRGAARSDGERR